MELYYLVVVLSLPLCILLFSHNMLYIPVLLLLNKLSFIHSWFVLNKLELDLLVIVVYSKTTVYIYIYCIYICNSV